ncbi:MAG: hypothetical protein ACRD8A_12320 [Candidatus Acidiferrales bacterium]
MAVLRAWYWRFFTILGQKYAHQVLSMKYTLIAPSDRLGAAGFVVLATTPVTWLILYFVAEGLFRIFVAMGTGEACGLLPLVIIDYVCRPLFRPTKRQLPLVSDEVIAQGDHDLTISSCRRKPEWKHPYAIRYHRAFFRVVGQKTQTFGPRPYVYTLRRLGPGEVASGLRDYDPRDILSIPYQVQRLL